MLVQTKRASQRWTSSRKCETCPRVMPEDGAVARPLSTCATATTLQPEGPSSSLLIVGFEKMLCVDSAPLRNKSAHFESLLFGLANGLQAVLTVCRGFLSLQIIPVRNNRKPPRPPPSPKPLPTSTTSLIPPAVVPGTPVVTFRRARASKMLYSMSAPNVARLLADSADTGRYYTTHLGMSGGHLALHPAICRHS
jgi:hypothetical protein